MIPLLTSAQIREVDAYTIGHEPITSVNLMKRASKAFTKQFVEEYPDKGKGITVYCGTGNNGGDGLAIARLLKAEHYNVAVKITRFSEKSSRDFAANLKNLKGIEVTEIKPGDVIPAEQSDIIIDALLGSGLNKPLADDYARLVEYLNTLNRVVVAVDVPTGFYTEGEIAKKALVLKANLVITFQQAKLNFLLPESAAYMDRFVVADIGLDKTFIESLNGIYQMIEEGDVKGMLKPRKPFDHKGTYGHALIIAGQAQTMGAALLCSSACAHTGAGLTTACVPESGLSALNSALPEVMALIHAGKDKPVIKWDKFNAVAIGPGLGTDGFSFALLDTAFKAYLHPLVIDADALNILADNYYLIKKVPVNSIITPHMKEFDRIFGEHTSWWNRIETMRNKAKEHNLNIVLKNRYTIIATPAGKVYFNPTGNPAMASGGMGDVLTGIITSLLAQGYSPEEACIVGVYLHGKTGDDMAFPDKLSTVLAGELAKNIPVTLAKLRA
ncbi:MAG: NAD(P)H-hydrate dehydratase [Mucilaginibacter sp.]|uniref:NAD(P)H-hydrate dehydratase n=1 Tax=Mucilaginibacter sp. TaxID=1882438 RepID=UPI003267A888